MHPLLDVDEGDGSGATCTSGAPIEGVLLVTLLAAGDVEDMGFQSL